MTSPKDVVLAWVRAFNDRDADAAAACYHPDAVNHQVAAGPPTVGRDAIREDFRRFFAAFPDSTTTPVNLLADGDWMALEWTGGATWLGPFAGREPNGRTFTLQGCGFFRFRDGKVAFQRGYWDRATWFGQLGIPLG